MAQFAVYRNRNTHTKALFPLLVDVQTDLLDELLTRVVIPLSKAPALTRKPARVLAPVLRLEGEEYVLMTPELAGIPRSALGVPVGSLAAQRDTILAAMDFLLAGF
jgi:toxin CcdB